MKSFLGKCILLGFILLGVYLFAQWQLSQNYVDQYYDKFTYKAGSLILGVSRAHDGIVPSIIDSSFNEDNIDKPVLNFAFELAQSSYGAVYLKAIKEKLKPKTSNGLFMLSVTPGNLSRPKSVKDTGTLLKADQKSILAKLTFLNIHPNFEYITRFYGEALYKAFYRHDPYNIRVAHDDGWMEVKRQAEKFNVKQNNIKEWTNMTLNAYQKKVAQYHPSPYRISYLKKTIEWLKKYGKVILVRLPIEEKVLNLENKYWSNFNKTISKISRQYHVKFIDFSNKNKYYSTYDGSHLLSKSAKGFTRDLCKAILNKSDNNIENF